MDSNEWVAALVAAASKMQNIPHQKFHGWLLAFLAG
jgi:hypothetical protein